VTPILLEAKRQWAVANGTQILEALSGVRVQVADLPEGLLAKTEGKTIFLDRDAAGRGWFVDPTPTKDDEYVSEPHAERQQYGQLRAVDPQAVDRIDLLTVVEHELGHIAGLDDLDLLADNLMSGVLATGVRRTPSPALVA
jgi:large repetitive protein